MCTLSIDFISVSFSIKHCGHYVRIAHSVFDHYVNPKYICIYAYTYIYFHTQISMHNLLYACCDLFHQSLTYKHNYFSHFSDEKI